MQAGHFNFILDDLGAGDHNVVVRAAINIDKTAGLGDSEAKALVGKGSLTVEEVRLVKGVPIILQ